MADLIKLMEAIQNRRDQNRMLGAQWLLPQENQPYTHQADQRSMYQQNVPGMQRAANSFVDAVLGGSTEQEYQNRMLQNYTLPEVEAIQPAFMGMDTVTSAVVPRIAQMYGRYAVRNAPRMLDAGNKAMTGGAMGFRPELEMTAYHGTPNKWIDNQANTKYIDTGEGSQMEGWGLYFAENKKTGEQYKIDLSDPGKGHLYEVDIPDKQINDFVDLNLPLNKQPDIVKNVIIDEFGDTFPFVPALDSQGTWNIKGPFGDFLYLEGKGERSKSRAISGAKDMLEGYTRRLNMEGSSHGYVYRAVSSMLGGDEKASKWFLSKGIKGSKYLDAGSREAGEGTRNFVVFDEDIVKTLKRNDEEL